ncbi:hypothetical protein A6R68_19086 [Neotoma lepida]|uniref:Protein MIS12 homolog n=1 Tax=Neotoma lepida TaxID=56216 RepID=A0A1A6HKN9_NEOLE|nr:hypothetical protein A6R68_19086 [Neotoma lepida]
MSVDPMAYEAQFFGFTPQTCLLRIYIAFQDHLFEVMQAVEQVILKKLEGIPDSEISPVQIHKCQETHPFSEEKFQLLKKEIEELQEKYKVELCTEQALLAELEEQKTVKAKLKETLTFFDELENIGRDHGTSNFRESLVSLVQNCRKLQNIRDNLRLLQALGPPGSQKT